LHVWGDHPVPHITREIDDMTATTLERGVAIERPLTPAEHSAREAEMTWFDHMTADAKRVARRGWERFTTFLAWARERATATVRWVWDHAKAGGRRTKAGAVQSKNWMRSATIGAYEFVRPAARWVATPFRATFGTSVGLASLLIFGGKFIVLVGLPWVVYLLMTGRLQMVKREVTEARADQMFQGDVLVLSEVQQKALNDRRLELDVLLQQSRNRSVGQVSQTMGRIHILDERLKGITKPPAEIFNEYKASHEAHFAGSPDRLKDVSWVDVKRGMQQENALIRKLLSANLDSAGEVAISQLSENHVHN
jgi:hypothetical protein